MTAPENLKNRGLVAFGRIVRVHGLRGALRVRPHNPDSHPAQLGRMFVERAGVAVEYRVRGFARAGRGALKLELQGIDTVEQAQALSGALVYVAAGDLPAAREREFYYFQVIGLRVETTDGRVLGSIDEVFFNGANDVWVVRDAGGEVLIPVIDDVVRRIDMEAGKVIVEPITGLLD